MLALGFFFVAVTAASLIQTLTAPHPRKVFFRQVEQPFHRGLNGPQAPIDISI